MTHKEVYKRHEEKISTAVGNYYDKGKPHLGDQNPLKKSHKETKFLYEMGNDQKLISGSDGYKHLQKSETSSSDKSSRWTVSRLLPRVAIFSTLYLAASAGLGANAAPIRDVFSSDLSIGKDHSPVPKFHSVAYDKTYPSSMPSSTADVFKPQLEQDDSSSIVDKVKPAPQDESFVDGLSSLCKNERFVDDLGSLCKNERFADGLSSLCKNERFADDLGSLCENERFVDGLSSLCKNERFVDDLGSLCKNEKFVGGLGSLLHDKGFVDSLSFLLKNKNLVNAVKRMQKNQIAERSSVELEQRDPKGGGGGSKGSSSSSSKGSSSSSSKGSSSKSYYSGIFYYHDCDETLTHCGRDFNPKAPGSIAILVVGSLVVLGVCCLCGSREGCECALAAFDIL